VNIHPFAALRLRSPRLELRLASHEELVELAEVARRGVHDPAEMPFEVAWTDRFDEPGFVEEFVAFHDGQLSRSRAGDWHLELVAFAGASPIGVQGIGATRFAETRAFRTGSWLARSRQGRGLGTEMRAAVLTFAFDRLGAEIAESATWERNAPSLAVSRKLGYVDVGSRTPAPRGEPLVHRELRLERAAFTGRVAIEVDGLEAALPLLLA